MDYMIQLPHYQAGLTQSAAKRVVFKYVVRDERKEITKKPEHLRSVTHYDSSYVWIGDAYNNLYPQNVIPNVPATIDAKLKADAETKMIDETLFRIHKNLDNDMRKYFEIQSLDELDAIYRKIYFIKLKELKIKSEQYNNRFDHRDVNYYNIVDAIIYIIKGMVRHKFRQIIDENELLIQQSQGNVKAKSKSQYDAYFENKRLLPLRVDLEMDWTPFLNRTQNDVCYVSCDNSYHCDCNKELCGLSESWIMKEKTRLINNRQQYVCYPKSNDKYSLAKGFKTFSVSHKAKLYINMLTELDILDQLQNKFNPPPSVADYGGGGLLNYYKQAKLDYLNLCQT